MVIKILFDTVFCLLEAWLSRHIYVDSCLDLTISQP